MVEESKTRSVCVFCSSSDAIAERYRRVAVGVATEIGRRGETLVYGGTTVGLMGECARTVKKSGGRVVGIVLKEFKEWGIANEEADELIAVGDLRERKAEMDARAGAFVVLPGGLGTLEETIEVLNLRFLRVHEKPIVFFNEGGFFDPLFHFFERLYEEKFTKREVAQLFAVVDTAAELFHHLDHFRPVEVDKSWYDRAKG